MNWCLECGAPCFVKIVDVGRGYYEYAGAVGFHIDRREVSACCEAKVMTSATSNAEEEY